jgi:hypothetical protein
VSHLAGLLDATAAALGATRALACAGSLAATLQQQEGDPPPRLQKPLTGGAAPAQATGKVSATGHRDAEAPSSRQILYEVLPRQCWRPSARRPWHGMRCL